MKNKIEEILYKNVDFYEVDTKNFELTKEGYLIIDALATRTGVFKYHQKDGSILRQYRPKEEVFKKDSYSSLSNKPVTNEHPPEFVNSKNIKKYQIGFVKDNVSVVDDKYIKASLVIQDAETIKEIQDTNKVQVSCGYTCSHENKDGDYGNDRYDVIQRNIDYNHISIVRHGRAGDKVRLLTTDSKSDIAYMVDSGEEESIIKQEYKEKELIDCIKRGPKMEKITIDGITQEVTAEFKAAFEVAQNSKQLADSLAKLDESKKELAKKTAEFDSLKDKSEKLELKVKETDSLISDRNKKDIILDAKSKGLIKDGDIETDSLSEVEIKKAILIKNEASLSMVDSDDYINGRYTDFLFDSVKKEESKIKFNSDSVTKKKVEDSVKSTVNESHHEFMARTRGAK